MNTLTKLALGLMGQLQPQPAVGRLTDHAALPSAPAQRRLAADAGAAATRVAA